MCFSVLILLCGCTVEQRAEEPAQHVNKSLGTGSGEKNYDATQDKNEKSISCSASVSLRLKIEPDEILLIIEEQENPIGTFVPLFQDVYSYQRLRSEGHSAMTQGVTHQLVFHVEQETNRIQSYIGEPCRELSQQNGLYVSPPFSQGTRGPSYDPRLCFESLNLSCMESVSLMGPFETIRSRTTRAESQKRTVSARLKTSKTWPCTSCLPKRGG